MESGTTEKRPYYQPSLLRAAPEALFLEGEKVKIGRDAINRTLIITSVLINCGLTWVILEKIKAREQEVAGLREIVASLEEEIYLPLQEIRQLPRGRTEELLDLAHSLENGRSSVLLKTFGRLDSARVSRQIFQQGILFELFQYVHGTDRASMQMRPSLPSLRDLQYKEWLDRSRQRTKNRRE